MHQDFLLDRREMADNPFMPARGIADWRYPPFLKRHSGREPGFLPNRLRQLRSQALRMPGQDACADLAALAGHGMPALKPPVPLDLNTPFVATRDGIVLARGECEQDSAGWMEGLQTLGGNPCVVAMSSCQYSPLENILVKSGSFCMPVRKGTPFQVRNTTAFGNLRASAYFCELSQPMAFPGAMESLSPCTLYKARRDGFLLARISAFGNGAGHEDQGSHGRIEVFSWPDSEMPAADGLMETASAHFHPSGRWIMGNTVMLLMPAGNRFKVELKIRAAPARSGCGGWPCRPRIEPKACATARSVRCVKTTQAAGRGRCRSISAPA